ncbi:MetQ/NlpA family ABC transporter substrate-binding protein [Thauera mechernichensis]|uniref:Lipoprotein n=1 Tax=Thauera mechernichensis TaxID=82788 RepID=A0ABW3WKX9_9RHOO|nr:MULTISPECIES: MetQ/NlpA family ABC transporter substrate-binding protein [Thauera]ENO74857.1 NLPA lipoprotein [Thauera sp. 27]MDG3066453.1 MetQ/NlpA family ABC transporter substrate-binding protein [Thauera mechernichensis]
MSHTLRKLFIASLGALTLGAAANASAADRLVIAATPVPHAEILEFVKPLLAKDGVELEVKVFTDYVQPSMQTNEKRVDGNFFLHQPYLDAFKQKQKNDIQVVVTKVHVEPLGAYSAKHKAATDIPDGATVAIPNDPSNSGRALLLMAKNGLITLKDINSVSATQKDIAANPKKLRIRELEAATLPRILNQVDLAVINTNYAIEARLNPLQDSLFIEDASSPYANLLVAREDNADSAAMKKLAAALNSEEVRQFIADKYQGAVVPAF